MATTFNVRYNHNMERFDDVVSEGSVIDYDLDFSVWAEDNSSVSSVAWSVADGSAAVANASLSSNVASAQVTFANSGWNLLKIAATGSGGQVCVAYIAVRADEPPESACCGCDYGR